MSEDCVFCDIIAGKLPAKIIYRDSEVISFFPRTQYALGHTLIVPLAHYRDLFDMPDSVSASVLRTAKLLGEHYRDKLGSTGVNLMHASGRAAQQSVFHFHVHLIPRFPDDNLNTMPHLAKWEGNVDEVHESLKI